MTTRKELETRVKHLEERLGAICCYPLCDCKGPGCGVIELPPPEMCARSDLRECHGKYKRSEATIKRLALRDHRLEQKLAQTLGFPWYCDDQKNFPGATHEDGVCTGELVLDDMIEMVMKKRADADLRICELGNELHKVRGKHAGCKDWKRWFDASQTKLVTAIQALKDIADDKRSGGRAHIAATTLRELEQ